MKRLAFVAVVFGTVAGLLTAAATSLLGHDPILWVQVVVAIPAGVLAYVACSQEVEA